MFNKKLKEHLMMLKHENDTLWDKVNDYSWKQERQEKEVEGLNKVIEAQATIIEAFAEYIISLDKQKEKGKKNVKKA